MKTIRPCSLGGMAGGEKYICHSIVFKFAVDVQVSGGSWMYGVNSALDEAAMKVASNELNGLIQCFKCEIRGLHLPLAALIDYRGYRLMALSLLPIDRSTLIYGSDDAGRTVVNKTKLFSAKMEQLASKLNLMGHMVHGTKVFGPADLEGHRGKDGRFYMLDFSRTFPPECPKRAAEDGPLGQVEARAIFYKLLRPELVRRSDIPLSSDAFSLFQRDDPKERALNGQVQAATEMLYNEIIPEYAMSLSELETLEEVTESMHRAGINVRHMGRVRKLIKPTAVRVRMILMSEMCARCVKVFLRAAMRERMKEYGLPSVEPYTAVVLDVLNLVFGGGMDSALFWRNTGGVVPAPAAISSTLSVLPIKVQLRDKFMFSLDEAENKDQMDLRDVVDFSYMVTLLQKMLNISLSRSAVESLASVSAKSALATEWSVNDILSIGAKIKRLPIIDYYTGIQLALAAAARTGDENKRLVLLAENCFRSTLATLPDHGPSYFQWGKLLHAQATRSKELDTFNSALQRLKMALDIDPRAADVMNEYALTLEDWGEVLLVRAVAEHSKTFLRQAIDKFREACKYHTEDKTGVRMMEMAKALLEKIARTGTSPDLQHNEFVFGGVHQILEVIRKRNEDAMNLQDSLLLDWGLVLAADVKFQDSKKDSVNILKASEKLHGAWPRASEERQEQVLRCIDYASDVDLLRFFVLAKFFAPFKERVLRRCLTVAKLSLVRLKGLTDTVLTDFWGGMPNLVDVQFIFSHLTDAMVGVLCETLPHINALAFPGCVSLSREYLPKIAARVGPNLLSLDLTLCYLDDEVLKPIAQMCVNLERVSLHKTPISGETLTLLCRSCKNLAFLDVGGCANLGEKFLANIVAYCSNLQTLVLSALAQVNSKSVALVAKMPKLGQLDLSFCDKIDEKA